MNTIIIPERLRSLRAEFGWSQTQAAERIHVSQPAYQRYENGQRSPSTQIAQEIADAFDTSVSYLTGESNQKTIDRLIVSRDESPILFSIVKQCRNADKDQLMRLYHCLIGLSDIKKEKQQE